MSYKHETVVSAEWVRRPGGILGSGHHGVRVHTEQGNSYLIHNAGPGTSGTAPGVHCTPASNMSQQWKSRPIDVKQRCTVQELMTVGARNFRGHVPASGRRQYLNGPTCVGTARRIKRHLRGGGGGCNVA